MKWMMPVFRAGKRRLLSRLGEVAINSGAVGYYERLRINGERSTDVLVGNGDDDHLRDRAWGTDECYPDERVGTPTDC